MAITRTQLDQQQVSASATCTSDAVSVTAGELVVVQLGGSKYDPAFLSSGVTWNGEAFTKAVSLRGAGAISRLDEVSIWYLVAASTASATVIATFAGSQDDINMNVSKVTGFDAGTPVGDTDTQDEPNDAGGVEPSLTLTTAVGDMVFDCYQYYSAGANAGTVGADQTAVFQLKGNEYRMEASVETASGASTTMSWTRDANRGFSYCAAVIKAAAGGGGSKLLLQLQHNGA